MAKDEELVANCRGKVHAMNRPRLRSACRDTSKQWTRTFRCTGAVDAEDTTVSFGITREGCWKSAKLKELRIIITDCIDSPQSRVSERDKS